MSWRERLSDERGYTLIELVMATAAGLVVCAAALAIVVSSLSFANGDSERIDSNQQGSVAMEKIVQALSSSCVVGYGISPIVGATGASSATGSTGVAPSSGDTLTFFSSLSDSPNINPSEISVYLTSPEGPLVMATYPEQSSTGASGATTYSYAATPATTFTLVSHAAPPGTTPTQASTTPIFTYYGYNVAAGTLTQQYSPSPYSTSPLGASGASGTVEVGINFQSQPGDGNNQLGGSADLSDNVVLRLTAVANGATGTTGATTPKPCS
jgi:type II secretory pathway pseudopilin PulG